MSDPIIIDNKSRESIVSDIKRNYFVEAGAGSGKTTMLVRRMVAMVESGISVDKICAITFTKAAAKEFYARFQQLLSERSTATTVKSGVGELSKPTDKTRAYCKTALENIDLCFLGTIDSFCNMVLMEHPIDAHITSDTNLTSGKEYKKQLLRLFRECLKDEARCPGLSLFLAKNAKAKAVFIDGISKYLEHRNLKLHVPKLDEFRDEFEPLIIWNSLCRGCLKNTSPNVLLDVYEKNIGKLDDYREELLNLLEEPAQEHTMTKDEWEELIRRKANIQIKKASGGSVATWKLNKKSWTKTNIVENTGKTVKLVEFMSRYRDALRYYFNVFKPSANNKQALEIFEKIDDVSKASSLPIEELKQLSSVELPSFLDLAPGEEDLFTETLGDNRFSLDKTVSEKKDPLKIAYFCVTADYLFGCVPEIETELKKSRSMSYFDCILTLRDLLKEDIHSHNATLIRHITGRHKYFLLDEFQDTNPLQAEVFFYLSTWGEKAKVDWKECIPQPGALFIVGDPKQSIYRFRGADIVSYNSVKSMFKAPVGECLSLPRNFRSSLLLRKKFNEYFKELFQPNPQENFPMIQGTFENIPENTDNFTAATFPNPVCYYDTSVSKGGDDPYRVLEIVRNLKSEAYQLRDEKEVKYGDILIITPTTTHLSEYTRLFYNNRIPFRIEGASAFGDCSVLLFSVAILGIIVNGTDNRNLYIYLKQAVGLSEEQFTNLAAGKKLDKESLSSVTDPWLSECYSRLFVYQKNAYSTSPAAMLSTLIEDSILEGLPLRNLEYAYFALELVRSKEASGEINGYREMYDYLQELIKDSSKDYERCFSLNGIDNDCVRIANLHKVKGLEAPVVILAWPSEKEQEGEFCVEDGTYYSHQIPSGEKLPISHDKLKLGYDSFVSACEEAEKKRLTYVAATRAKDFLIVAKPEELSNNTHDPWEFLSATASEIPSELLKEDFVPSEENKPAITRFPVKTESVLGRAECKDQTYALKRPSLEVKVSTVISSESMATEDQETEEERITFSTTLRKDLLGTMVHRLMEILIGSKQKADLKDTVTFILAENDISGDADAEKLLIKIGDTMLKGGIPQDNGAPTDIFKELRGATEILCEVPFCQKDDSETPYQIINGVIDLLYRKVEKWHLIDWKTNGDGGGEKTASVWQKHYDDQLKIYCRALKKEGVDLEDAFIYHIPVDHTKE